METIFNKIAAAIKSKTEIITSEKAEITSTAIKSLKADIVTSAAIQKAMKNQRKTTHLKGERIYEPWEASMNVFLGGMKLRIMYAAYGLMRGKKFSETENHYPEENHPLNKYINAINKCIKVHTKKVEEKVEINV